MTDKKIIDISLMKTLKQNDSNVDANNINIKMKFVNVANEIIQEVIGQTDKSFTNVLKKYLPKEITEDFIRRNIPIESIVPDLNILSSIERMLGMNPVIFYPTCTDANMSGWISGFHVDGCMFSSPEMETEAKARAFTILLFLKLRK